MIFIRLFFVSCMLITSSCASIENNNIAPTYTQAFKAIKGAIFGFQDANISREVVDKIPYASGMMKIGKGSKGLVILESTQKGINTWISADNVLIAIDNGKIVRTLGLINNLTSYKTARDGFKDLVLTKEPLLDYFSYYSYDKPLLNNLRVKASIYNRGIDEVEILGVKRSLILFEEEIYSEDINWSRTNKFWVDPNSFYVWKSIQHVSPRLPVFTFEVTKKPAL